MAHAVGASARLAPGRPRRALAARRGSRCAPARGAAPPVAGLASFLRALAPARTLKLPNGLLLDYVSRADVPVLYDEVFVQRIYSGSHGIPPLRPGDVVVDVGANVGVFAIDAARAVAPGGAVLAVEPAPAAADALRRNLARHAPPGVAAAVAQVALSDAEHPAATLFVYPKCAGWSTLFPDEDEVEANTAAFAKSAPAQALQAAGGGPLRLFAPLVAALQRAAAAAEAARAAEAGPSPPPKPVGLARLAAAVRAFCAALYAAAFRFMLARLRRGATRVAVPLTTLSALLAAEAAAGRIPPAADVALLKIDVERAELAVLRGVAAADWRRVRAVAAEVHDAGGALAAVTRLLQSPPAAFDTVTAVQAPAMRGSNLYNVYATRSAKAAGADA